MSDPYQAAFAYTLSNEGRVFVNDPLDRGGPTRYGITQLTLSHYLGRPATVDEVADMTLETASAIYRQLYWTPLKLDQADSAVATALFDAAVLCGPSRAVKLAQRVLQVKDDGLLGPLTSSALSRADRQDFLLQYVPQLVQFFLHIVTYDPTQAKFLEGWTRRSLRLLSLLRKPPAPPALPPSPVVAAL